MKTVIEAARAFLEYVDNYHPLDGSAAHHEVATALRNAIRAWDERTQLTPDLLAAIRDARANGQSVAVTPSGAVAFINDGSEPDYSHLDCPACGGSGHIDDAQSGVGRIAAERRRQIEKEGWTLEHDTEHPVGELARAGACYAAHAAACARLGLAGEWGDPPSSIGWPWARKWWKPAADQRRNLEKAGALIAAEIDRLQRSGQG